MLRSGSCVSESTDLRHCLFCTCVRLTFFYTSVVFRPEQVAENIQNQGGFIPGSSGKIPPII